MGKRRTPEEELAAAEADLRRARMRRARSQDPLIDDLLHIKEDLRGFPFTVTIENSEIASAIAVVDAEIAARVARALESKP